MSKSIVEGTKVVITNQGNHFLVVGSVSTIQSHFDGDTFGARGPIAGGGQAYQLIHSSDFRVATEKEVQAQEQASQPKSEGETNMSKFAVGQVVRITGAKVDPFASFLAGKEVTTHSLPVGAITKIVEIAPSGDEFAKVSVEGIAMTHDMAKPGPQWVGFEYLEDATGKDLSKDGEGEVTLDKREIKVGDYVTIIGNEISPLSMMFFGRERGIHGVEIGRTLQVIEANEENVKVDTRFEVLADEDYVEESQRIPLEMVMLASVSVTA